MKDKMNYLEKVSFAFKHGKDKAREEYGSDDVESIEEKKKKRKIALAFFEPEDSEEE